MGKLNNIGSKASNLIRIRDEFKLPIPAFEVLQLSELLVNFDSVSQLAESAYLEFRKSSDSKTLEKRLGLLRASLVLDSQFIAELADRVHRAGWREVSLRTSAALEDGEGSSFAGQYRTLLDVSPTVENLKAGIRECIVSILEMRVFQYAASQKFERFDFAGSVVVQQMFFGTSSGVLFTEDGSGNLFVASNDSWRNQVVEGASASEYLIPRVALTSEKLNISTDEQLMTQIEVSGEKLFIKSLPTDLGMLCDFALKIEAKVGTPVDIEWASLDGKVVLLQFRPITVAQIDYTLEWDSTNISENYPGITLPLTYSTIRELYAGVYPAFLRLLGTKEKQLNYEVAAFQNMLGYLNGHVYYRISNWYALLKFLPGKNNEQFFEAMLNPVDKKGAKGRRPSLNLANLIAISRFVLLLARSNRLSLSFKMRFAKRLAFYSSYCPEFINAQTLLESSKKVREDLLSEWAVPILNDIKLMVFHGMLQKYFFTEAQNSEYLDFLQGLSDRASIRPLEELSKLGSVVSRTLEETGVESIEELKTSSAWSAISERAAQYVEEFASRTPGELKLESVRISDRLADVLVLALKAHESGFKALDANSNIEISWPSGLPKYKRPLLRWVAGHTRRAIDWRERFRFNRAQTFDLSRRMFDSLGQVLANENLISEPRDIYWLTQQEIDEIVNGHAWSLDAKVTVQNRKNQFEEFSQTPMPLAVRGAGRIAATKLVRVGGDSSGALSGKGVAPGELTAEVIVTTEFDPNLDVSGKILVVHHIDPGWTLLFTQAAGIIAERGNALSHAAIIAREIGIPAIVAVEGATTALSTGDVISINGVLGTISSESN